MIGFNWMSGSKILLILLLASGCQSSTTLNPQASGTCANEPDRSLIDQTAPKLNVSSGESITQTGKIKSNQGVTYQIEAQTGQTLNFKVTLYFSSKSGYKNKIHFFKEKFLKILLSFL